MSGSNSYGCYGTHPYVYVLSERTYKRYGNGKGSGPHCAKCDLELMPWDGVVSKARSGGRRVLYCPFCAVESGIASGAEVRTELGPPDEWLELRMDIMETDGNCLRDK